MMIQSETMVSIADASRDFSRVARLVDEKGSAVILKNNAPRYLVIDFSRAEEYQEAFLKFTDLSTLPERMKKEETIAMEYRMNCLRLVNSLLKKTGLRMRHSPND